MIAKLAEAKRFYRQIGDPDDFERDLGIYLASGYVFSSPGCIIFGKPVLRAGDDPDSQWSKDPSECDAWYVKFACGKGMFSEFQRAIPFELPWVGWMRALKNKPVMWWRMDQILRRK